MRNEEAAVIIIARPGGIENFFLEVGSEIGPRQEDFEKIFHSAPAYGINSFWISLVRTHAGLNTVLESLTQGVPMVAIPVTNDQPGVAARIAYTRTGAYVPIQEMTASRLSVLTEEVLSNPAYRQNSDNMKQVIAKAQEQELAKGGPLPAEAVGRIYQKLVEEMRNWEAKLDATVSQSSSQRAAAK